MDSNYGNLAAIRQKGNDLFYPTFDGGMAVLVQPQITYGKSMHEFRGDNKKPFEEIINDMMQFRNMRHAATIQFEGCFHGRSGVYKSHGCGGLLKYGPTSSRTPEWVREKTPVTLTCSNKECKMNLWSIREQVVLQSAMLHLMLKQISPLGALSRHTCNFAYCGDKEDSDIRALGTVSIAMDILTGQLSIPHKNAGDEQVSRGALAFMLMPGINVFCSTCGYDFSTWIGVLEDRMHAHQKYILDLAKQLQFGPKPLQSH